MEKDYNYYMTTQKIVRDLVHEYIDLTRFELELIDNASFQRLKDVRQLTCHHVYPEARHTRFEHSLGVLELTRKALNHLNRNGLLFHPEKKEKVISDQLIFNTCIAALLHDVGHCPFSHMGEGEFNQMQVQNKMLEVLMEYSSVFIDIPESFEKLLDSFKDNKETNLGCVHEQLSCIVIMKNYYEILSTVRFESKEDNKVISIDFEFLIRCIIGMEYDVNTVEEFNKYKVCNAMIRLINSSIFDMDKLDYIMRDSHFTGIGTPKIDTKRLFRNMYFDDKYSIFFTSKAVPSLQNMIDARDGLYMYVYNHHAVVFSDFLNTYIVRRITHCMELLDRLFEANQIDETKQIKNKITQIVDFVPKDYLFSIDSILKAYRSDGDWLSVLNNIHLHYDLVTNDSLINRFRECGIELDNYENEFKDRIQNTIEIVHQLRTRQFLKPWWKTVFEFSNFMQTHFPDDNIRKEVGNCICSGGNLKGENRLKASEFRSQIAKHVVFITTELKKQKCSQLIAALSEGEFFIVQRSTRFFAPDTIEKLGVCLKASEMTGTPKDAEYKFQDYYVKALTRIIPQKDYSALYAKEGFYVFTAPVEKYKSLINNPIDIDLKQAGTEQKVGSPIQVHYKCIEKIFVYVVTSLLKEGEQRFVETFQKGTPEELKERENKHKQEMAKEFINLYCKEK